MERSVDIESIAARAKRNPTISNRDDLFHHSRPLAFRAAFLLMKDREKAEDVAQEALTHLTKEEQLQAWKMNSSWSTYVHSVIYRKAIDAVRKENRTPTLPLKESAAHPGFMEETNQRLFVQSILDRIALLQPEDQEILMKIHAEQKSYIETAEELNMAIGTVKSRLNRAVSRLRESLKQDYQNAKIKNSENVNAAFILENMKKKNMQALKGTPLLDIVKELKKLED